MKENVIIHLSHKMEKLQIRSLPRQKKYLISQESRDFLKLHKKSYVGIIPFRSVSLPIYNPKKELFLHQTELLTQEQKMLVLPTDKNYKESQEVKKIKKYLESILPIKIKNSDIHQILDVESSKIKIYLVNLTKIKVVAPTPIKGESVENVTDKLKGLSLDHKLDDEVLKSQNLKFQKILNFYNQIEVRKSIRDLYQNIGKLRQNKSTLEKYMTLEIENKNLTQINLKLHFIYHMLARILS